MSERSERSFPIMREGRDARGYRVSGTLYVPWKIGEEAWQRYAAKYGRGQSVERIAERGGFGEYEMDEFRPGWQDFILRGEQA